MTKEHKMVAIADAIARQSGLTREQLVRSKAQRAHDARAIAAVISHYCGISDATFRAVIPSRGGAGESVAVLFADGCDMIRRDTLLGAMIASTVARLGGDADSVRAIIRNRKREDTPPLRGLIQQMTQALSAAYAVDPNKAALLAQDAAATLRRLAEAKETQNAA